MPKNIRFYLSVRDGERAFTLIELLVVMIVIALVAAISTPLLSKSLEKVTLRSSTKKIAAIFRFARQQSIMRQKPYIVALRPEANTLVLMPAEQDESSVGDRESEPSYKLDDTIAIEPSAEFIADTHGGSALFFYDDGSSSGGHLIVRDQRDRQMRIDIDLVTGIVSVSEG